MYPIYKSGQKGLGILINNTQFPAKQDCNFPPIYGLTMTDFIVDKMKLAGMDAYGLTNMSYVDIKAALENRKHPPPPIGGLNIEIQMWVYIIVELLFI